MHVPPVPNQGGGDKLVSCFRIVGGIQNPNSIKFADQLSVRYYLPDNDFVEGSTRAHMLKFGNSTKYGGAEWAETRDEVHRTRHACPNTDPCNIWRTRPAVPNVPVTDIPCVVGPKGKRKFIGDTGSGSHLISASDLTEEERSRIRKSAVKMRLHTANDVITVDECTDVFIEEMGEILSPLVLLNTPAVVSIGLICMEQGGKFEWLPGQTPTLTLRDGRVVRFTVEHNVPYMLDVTYNPEPTVYADGSSAPAKAVKTKIDKLLKPKPSKGKYASKAVDKEGDASGNADEPPEVEIPQDVGDPPEITDPEVLCQLAPLSDGKRRDLWRESKSIRHLMTHLPKNPYCAACYRAKMYSQRPTNPTGESAAEKEQNKPKRFGDSVTADHMIAKNENSKGLNNACYAMVIGDNYTEWLEFAAQGQRNSLEAYAALNRFANNTKVKEFYCDNAPELLQAAKTLKWVNPTSTPYRSTSNAKAERNNRLVLEGIRSVLSQSGLPSYWWPYAGKYFCWIRNVECRGGDSAYNRRFRRGHWKGKWAAFGQEIDFRPPPPVLEQLGKFDEPSLPGIFLGYKVHPGGKWHGEYYVAYIKDFESNTNPYVRVFTVREIWLNPKGPIRFPLMADELARKRTIKSINYNKYSWLIGDDYPKYGDKLTEPTSCHKHIQVIDDPANPESKVDEVEKPADEPTVPEHTADQALADDLSVEPDGEPIPLYPAEADEPHPNSASSKSPPNGHASSAGGGDAGDQGGITSNSNSNVPNQGGNVPKIYPSTSNRPPSIDPDTWSGTGVSITMKKHWVELYLKNHPDTKWRPRDPKFLPDDWIEPATAAHKIISSPSGDVKRTIVEFCCGEDSELGNSKYQMDGCTVIRCTEKDDVTTKSGLERAIAAVSQQPCLLWASMPCTGGSARWAHNVLNEGGPEKLEAHRAKFRKIWSSFVVVARACHANGGRVAIEWPTSCTYWRWPCVQKLVSELQLQRTRVNGCAMGLAGGPQNLPICKPWDICTNEGAFDTVMAQYRCPGPKYHPCHCETNGSINKKTERYTPKMCQLIHKSWKIAAQCWEPDQEPGHKALIAEPLSEPEPAWGKEWECPAMPVEPSPEPDEVHGNDEDWEWPVNAAVAKQLKKNEWKHNDEAMAALWKEYEGLREAKVWDESTVTDKSSLMAFKRRSSRVMHIAQIFSIVVLKGSELPKGSKGRKYKGRIVFMGNQVRDQYGDVALFQDTASAPASIESAKLIVANGLIGNNVCEQADALQAYVQSYLEGEETWIAIPEELWLKEWTKSGKYTKDNPPCVRLMKALYGHPEAGKYWEKHAEKRIYAAGFQKIGVNWRSMFYHPVHKTTLMVYVDDFMMSGPKPGVDACWKLLRTDIRMEDPTTVNKCLGINHTLSNRTINGRKVRCCDWDMNDFAKQCVDLYLELCPSGTTLRPATTPFLDESQLNHLRGKPGKLQPIASRMLMKMLYMARSVRYDILKAIASLATMVTKWDEACDRSLHRLVCYIKTCPNYSLRGFVGESAENLYVDLYTDADLGGDPYTMRSSSGIFVAISGEHTFIPINAQAKKQDAVSHSTTEAEIVAAFNGMAQEGHPLKDFIQCMKNDLAGTVLCYLGEDNTATIQVIRSGYSPKLRYLNRTHKIDIAWLAEEVNDRKGMILYHCSTDKQRADILTKAFSAKDKWDHVRRLVGLVAPGEDVSSKHLLEGGSHGFVADGKDQDRGIPRPKAKAKVKAKAKAKASVQYPIQYQWQMAGAPAPNANEALSESIFPDACVWSPTDEALRVERPADFDEMHIHVISSMCSKEDYDKFHEGHYFHSRFRKKQPHARSKGVAVPSAILAKSSHISLERACSISNNCCCRQSACCEVGGDGRIGNAGHSPKCILNLNTKVPNMTCLYPVHAAVALQTKVEFLQVSNREDQPKQSK